MKKHILLILLAGIFTLSSCSNDDDGGDNENVNAIIGSWILVDASAPLNTQFCEDEESTITFNEDKTGEATFYLVTNDCEPESTDGNWNENDGLYTINVPFLGEVTGTATFEENDNRFLFTPQNVGATLTFERQ